MTDAAPAILVKAQSPVANKDSYIYKWDSFARSVHANYEVALARLEQGKQALGSNPFTRFKDPIQFQHRAYQIEMIKRAQMLGSFTEAELSEATSHLPSSYMVVKTKNQLSPLYAYNLPILIAALGAGGLFGAYGLVVKRYSFIWAGATVLPLLTTLVYNHAHQPQQHFINLLGYI